MLQAQERTRRLCAYHCNMGNPPPHIEAIVGSCRGFDIANWIVVLGWAFDTEEAKICPTIW